jgi:deoxyhypusine synthase
MGSDALYAQHPKARGYLRARAGYRLFEQREALCEKLLQAVRDNGEWLRGTLAYPLPGSGG